MALTHENLHSSCLAYSPIRHSAERLISIVLQYAQPFAMGSHRPDALLHFDID
jgi:hypothetical protein